MRIFYLPKRVRRTAVTRFYKRHVQAMNEQLCPRDQRGSIDISNPWEKETKKVESNYIRDDGALLRSKELVSQKRASFMYEPRKAKAKKLDPDNFRSIGPHPTVG